MIITGVNADHTLIPQLQLFLVHYALNSTGHHIKPKLLIMIIVIFMIITVISIIIKKMLSWSVTGEHSNAKQ